MNSIARIVVAAAATLSFWLAAAPAGAAPPSPQQLVPWLDVPVAWARKVEGDVVALAPDDLPAGATLVLMVEPARESAESLTAAYDQALRDLGPWRPVGKPAEQKFDSGWTFRLGVGVATLNGTTYTAQTAVARRGALRVRFWALADSDATFNRYKDAIGTAIASAQDIAPPVGKAAPPQAAGPAPGATRRSASAPLPDGFGKGISGVYVGLERGLSARAGAGLGTQQALNPSTGRIETNVTAAAPQAQTQIGDALEVDVFYPDGTYRRRLPVRGLMSDLAWERRQQPILWGTWQRKGDEVVVRRGNYTTSYTVSGNTLVSARDRPWVKLPLRAGVRLDGTFARDDYRGADAPRLTLRPDGTYEERQDFLRMVGSPWHLVEPDADAMVGRWSDAQLARAMAGSRGSYAFDNFTLTLRATDGRVWQINAYLPSGEEPPRPRRLVINGRALLRD